LRLPELAVEQQHQIPRTSDAPISAAVAAPPIDQSPGPIDLLPSHAFIHSWIVQPSDENSLCFCCFFLEECEIMNLFRRKERSDERTRLWVNLDQALQTLLLLGTQLEGARVCFPPLGCLSLQLLDG
jgi:hypothetical protein